MRTSSTLHGIAALLAVAPAAFAQDIDFAMVDAAPNPSYSTALDATAQSVTYNPTTILAAVTASVTSVTVTLSDVADSSTAADVEKRAATTTTAATSGCATAAVQPTGAGPVPSPDTASAFLADAYFSSVAAAAPTPSGYTNTFSSQQASNNAYGYLGYTTLTSYDPVGCAAKCNKINGCMGINIYFERDPTVNPGSGCDNPPSTTNIKCVFWGGEVSSDSLSNTGQWRDQFQVVIAGSNGYMNNTLVPVQGFSEPTDLGNAAINAPYDSQGYNTYMGSTIFTSGPFNASLCADYCTAQNVYNLAHPPSDGSPVQTCQFFNTYILYINTTKNLQGQYCAIYSESWSQSYATNVGQYRGSDHYLIEYSYSYSNTTNSGTACKSCAIAQATRDISWSSQQAFCTQYLGLSVPVSTATVTQTASGSATTVTVASTTDVVSVFARAASSVSIPPNLSIYPTTVVSSACSLVATGTPSTSVTTATSTITAPPSTTTVTVPTITTTATSSVLPCGFTGPACGPYRGCPNGLDGVSGSGEICECLALANGASGCIDPFDYVGPSCSEDSDCAPGKACFSSCVGKTCQTVQNQCANPAALSRLFIRKMREEARLHDVKRQDSTQTGSLTTISGTVYLSTNTAFNLVPLTSATASATAS